LLGPAPGSPRRLLGGVLGLALALAVGENNRFPDRSGDAGPGPASASAATQPVSSARSGIFPTPRRFVR
jgi:hypothetical protein